MSFHGLTTYFLSVLNGIPPFQCTSLFTHSPAEGQLGCFQVWAIMNKTAINITCEFLCEHKFSSPLGKYQGARLLDLMGIVCLFL